MHWLEAFKSFRIITPKSFSSSTVSRIWPRSRIILLGLLYPKCIILHLSRLNNTEECWLTRQWFRCRQRIAMSVATTPISRYRWRVEGCCTTHLELFVGLRWRRWRCLWRSLESVHGLFLWDRWRSGRSWLRPLTVARACVVLHFRQQQYLTHIHSTLLNCAYLIETKLNTDKHNFKPSDEIFQKLSCNKIDRKYVPSFVWTRVRHPVLNLDASPVNLINVISVFRKPVIIHDQNFVFSARRTHLCWRRHDNRLYTMLYIGRI